jgi:hypothetical protein
VDENEDVLELAATAVTDAGDPLGALTAVSELRSELDRVERDQVALALDAGWSWAAIAGALGVSRQAAHKKHRDKQTTAGPARPKSLRSGRILVTSEARAAVRNAREEAVRCGQQQVGTEHLLLGILGCEYSVAVRALDNLGITLEAARQAAMPTLTQPPTNGDEHANGDGPISPVARLALEQSLREATRRGDGYLGVEHLLLSLIRDDKGGATRTLDALGAGASQVRDALESATAV